MARLSNQKAKSLSLRPPELQQPYETRGFPAVGKKEDVRAAVPITGEVIEYLAIDKELKNSSRTDLEHIYRFDSHAVAK